MVNLAHWYRVFRAHNKYDYPGFFLVVGCSKAVLQLGLVFGIIWFALPMVANEQIDEKFALEQNNSTAVKSVQFAGFAETRVQVEIPAAAPGNVSVQIRKTDTAAPAAKVGVYNADWLLKQNAGSYVVQLASSTAKPELFQKAFLLSETHPVVVYPFRKTRSNRLMYGYAIGMYDSFNEAQSGVGKLSASSVAEGVWIRSVGEIQKEIVSTRQSAL